MHLILTNLVLQILQCFETMKWYTQKFAFRTDLLGYFLIFLYILFACRILIIRDKKFNVLLKINCALPTQQIFLKLFTIINSVPVHTEIIFKLITAVHYSKNLSSFFLVIQWPLLTERFAVLNLIFSVVSI